MEKALTFALGSAFDAAKKAIEHFHDASAMTDEALENASRVLQELQDSEYITNTEAAKIRAVLDLPEVMEPETYVSLDQVEVLERESILNAESLPESVAVFLATLRDRA